MIYEIFTLDHADNLQPGKRLTSRFCALKRKAPMEQLHLAGPASEKSQK